MINEKQLMVSIRCLTYNHEQYIRQCLDGFLMQKTNFAFEAIVHDDASTDKTAEILREYAEKYPEIIKPIFEVENQYSKHDGVIEKIMNTHMRGKYIAFIEADDYWIDPLKLQKQVDFLENHNEVSLCYTDCDIFYEDEERWEKAIFKNGLASNPSNPLEGFGYRGNVTWMYRKSIFDTIVMKPSVDTPLLLLYEMCLKGKLGYISDVTGVFRRHEGAISYNSNNKNCYSWLVGVHQDLLLYIDEFYIGKKALIKKIDTYAYLSELSTKNNDIKISKYVNDQLLLLFQDIVKENKVTNLFFCKIRPLLLQPIRWIKKHVIRQ